MVLSTHAARLQQLALAEADTDKARNLGVAGGTGAADYLLRGEDLKLRQRMQDIQDAREARAQGKFDIALTQRRADALTNQVQRENAEARKAAYEEELARLKAERAQHEQDNLAFNAEVGGVTDSLHGMLRQAQEQGTQPEDLQVTGDIKAVPESPPLPAAAPPAAPGPLANLRDAVLPPARQPVQPVLPQKQDGLPDRVKEFSAEAPPGFGFTEAGDLVRDPEDQLAKTLYREAEDLPFHAKLLSDAEIEAKAQEFAAQLKVQNVRQTVLGKLKADAANEPAFKLLGDMGVQDMVDDYLGSRAKAKAKRDQEAFDNAITARDMTNKEKKTALELVDAQRKVFEAIGDHNNEVAGIGLRAREVGLKEKEFNLKVKKYRDQRSGNPVKFSKDVEKQLKLAYDDQMKAITNKLVGADNATADLRANIDLQGKGGDKRAEMLQRDNKARREGVLKNYNAYRPFVEAANEGYGERVRHYLGQQLTNGMSRPEAMDAARQYATELVRAKRGGAKAPTKKQAKAEPVQEEALAHVEANDQQYYANTDHGFREAEAKLNPEVKQQLRDAVDELIRQAMADPQFANSAANVEELKANALNAYKLRVAEAYQKQLQGQ